MRADSTTESSPLDIQLKRQGGELSWQVHNRSDQPIWAFLLVPSIVEGRLSFAEDTAWTAVEPDGTLVMSKVDTPVPDNAFAERVQSGAVRIEPGGRQHGTIRVGDNGVVPRRPYDSAPQALRPFQRVVMEVGWLPVQPDQNVRQLSWNGQPFAYLRPEEAPGGQRIARSAPLPW